MSERIRPLTLGIDFGTSNSACALIGANIRKNALKAVTRNVITSKFLISLFPAIFNFPFLIKDARILLIRLMAQI